MDQYMHSLLSPFVAKKSAPFIFQSRQILHTVLEYRIATLDSSSRFCLGSFKLYEIQVKLGPIDEWQIIPLCPLILQSF